MRDEQGEAGALAAGGVLLLGDSASRAMIRSLMLRFANAWEQRLRF